jgi:hypothetical protein
MAGISDEPFEPKDNKGNKKNKRRFRLKRFGEIRPATKPNYLIKGILPRVGLAVVWGKPKCGKSFWTYDAVMHIVLNWKYRGRKVQSGPAVYCALEGGIGFSRRVEAWRQHYLLGDQEDPPFYLLDVPLDLIADRAELIETIREQFEDDKEKAPAVVVIDTLNRALAGSENKPEDMAKFIRAADAIYTAFECLVIIVHHSGIEGGRPRGHTSLPGADDAQIMVERDSNGTGIITTTVEHMKDDEAGVTLTSRLKRVEIGPDEEGDEMSSCVIVACDGVASARKMAGRKDDDWSGGKGLKALRKAIMSLMADCGEPVTPRAGEPVVQALKLDYVRTEFTKTWPADGKTDKAKRDAKSLAFRRALREAVDREVIETRELSGEDYIWLAGAAEEARSEPTAGKTNGGDSGIAFMITAAMKQDLKARGFSDAEVFDMKPERARAILADEGRNADTERFSVVGEVMQNDTCVMCGKPDGVRLLKDSRTGGEPKPLHLRCAREWFDSKDVPPPD